MKKIFITGSEGFIGSHLVELLIKKGYYINALVKYNSFNSRGWLDHIKYPNHKNLKIFYGDIEDQNTIEKPIKNSEVVIHLASLISIPYSYLAPRSYINTNIIGTYNVMEISKKYKIKKIIHTSTSEVYGTALSTPMNEDHPLQPQSPYSASKISADAIAKSFFHSFELPVVTLRPFNTFGPRQSIRAVIPSIITQAINKKGIVEIGDIRPTRDFVFINDTIQGYLRCIENKKDLFGETINIGTGKEISIQDLVQKISKILKIKIYLKKNSKRIRPINSEVFRLKADNNKLYNILKWKPIATNQSLNKNLHATIEWFKDEKNLKIYKSGFQL